MRKIRIGKDILLRWTVLTGGKPSALAGRKLTLELCGPFGLRTALDMSVEAPCTVQAVVRGTSQRDPGDYSLTLWENRGQEGQTAVDAVHAFRLVRTTADEMPGCGCHHGGGDTLQCDTVDLHTASLEVITHATIATPGEGGAQPGSWDDIPDATAESHGLMPAADKQLLDDMRGALSGLPGDAALLATTER